MILLTILLTTSLFAQKEYNIDNIYESEKKKVFIKKFSDEIVNGNVYQMFGDQKVVLGKMVKGKKEGVWSGWYDNGIKKNQDSYIKGIKNGRSTEYYDEGTLKGEGTFKDGVMIGTIKIYHQNGKIKSIQKSRVADGRMYYAKEWKEDGSLELLYELDSLSLDGKYTDYYKGRILVVADYKNGLKDGIETSYEEDGSIGRTEEYTKGKNNGYKRIYRDGALVWWWKYKDGVKVEFYSVEDSINFVEDSTFIHKIADEGTKGYTTAFFNNAYGGVIYKTASSTDTLKQISTLKGYKVFPYIRDEGNDYVLVTNANNESIGYILKNKISFSNRNHIKEFDSDIRRVRFKHLLD